MTLMDTLQDGLARMTPQRKKSVVAPGSGIGNGMVSYEDDMIISKPAIIFHISQIFFNFLAMACFASVASFQAKWKIGPSGLSGFAIFVSVSGIFLSLFMMFVPVVYEKYDKFARVARALKEVRVGFILTGAGSTLSLLIAFIVTISAWTEPGCKNASNDPHAKELGDDFTNALPGWCSTKKAGSIFFWLAFGFWLASFILLIMDWRAGNLTSHSRSRQRDPPFTHPDIEEGEELDEDPTTPSSPYQAVPNPATTAPRQSTYSSDPPRQSTYNDNAASSPFADSNRTTQPSQTWANWQPSTQSPPAAPRQSMDAYGAFSDPAPSGFGGVSPAYAPAPASSRPVSSFASPGAAPAPEPPRVSRTMQYADPYAAVRASLAPATANPSPPSYESYQGYR
ncbi:hypothetical protein BV22DRAFT_1200103 [Leucogyrophana mollusca]|uniref:Uncharacterized protein n=1 Tax=Leucogyrophana mollusca TaxID=85980 RepID=A0ACB8AXQ3_9AGAM|nr:hypothetical protein BV22DRAFT_1200103 [Leucogyrophana mollusca]